MTTALERAQRMADKARERENPALRWWLITKVGGEQREVFFSPPATADEVRQRYPGCGVVRKG